MKEKLKPFLIKVYKKTVGKINNKRIQNKNVTIISNNCWAGVFYRNNNLEYLSPTLGLFFMAEDYINFIYDIRHYIDSDLVFIDIEQSKYKEYLRKLNYDSPIGKIDDIEIMFMHYKDEVEAREKWNKRKQRINWNNIIYKFSDQNMCTYEHLKKFSEFKAKNKVLFTTRKYKSFDSIQIKKYEKSECILNDIKYYKKYFNMYDYINEISGD